MTLFGTYMFLLLRCCEKIGILKFEFEFLVLLASSKYFFFYFQKGTCLFVDCAKLAKKVTVL